MRSWMTRSRLCALGSGLEARASGLAAFAFARFSFRVADCVPLLPAMFPRDDETEDDVKAAEAGGHEDVAAARGRGERRGAERHEDARPSSGTTRTESVPAVAIATP